MTRGLLATLALASGSAACGRDGSHWRTDAVGDHVASRLGRRTPVITWSSKERPFRPAAIVRVPVCAGHRAEADMQFDAGKVFILLVTAPFFGMIAWAEVRLRRRQRQQRPPTTVIDPLPRHSRMSEATAET